MGVELLFEKKDLFPLHIEIGYCSSRAVPALASVTPSCEIFHGAPFKIKNANII